MGTLFREELTLPPSDASDAGGRARPGRLTYLSEADKSAIYEAAIEIVSSIGMRVHHEEARALLAGAGCRVATDDVVCIPRDLVEEARATSASTLGRCSPVCRSHVLIRSEPVPK